MNGRGSKKRRWSKKRTDGRTVVVLILPGKIKREMSKIDNGEPVADAEAIEEKEKDHQGSDSAAVTTGGRRWSKSKGLSTSSGYIEWVR